MVHLAAVTLGQQMEW